MICDDLRCQKRLPNISWTLSDLPYNHYLSHENHLHSYTFPFHNPIGLLWVGVTLVSLKPSSEKAGRVWPQRLLQGGLALSLLLLAALQCHAARRRPQVEEAFQARRDPVATHAQARVLSVAYPFSADLFDLDSKSAIQAAMSSPNPTPAEILELDQLLKQDPFDHHLLLARAQIARRAGDEGTARELLNRYTEVAPKDPARFFRLAQDALTQGKPQMVPALIQAARSQPGFGPAQAAQAQELLSRAERTLQRR